MQLTPEEISTALATCRWRRQRHSRCVEAAVLLPLFNRGEHTHLLVIEKARDESRHAGQMAFPGGKRESSDGSALQTALREAREEINLQQEAVQVLGEAGYFRTMTSRFDAAVIVGWLLQPASLQANQEVRNIFHIPLEALLMDFNPSLNTCTRSGLLNAHYHVQPRDTARTICVWGLTARILHHFFMALYRIPDGD